MLYCLSNKPFMSYIVCYFCRTIILHVKYDNILHLAIFSLIKILRCLIFALTISVYIFKKLVHEIQNKVALFFQF